MPFWVFLPPLAINATSVYQELNGSVLGVQNWIGAVCWPFSKLFKLHLHVRHLGVRGQVRRHQLQLASRVGHAGPSAVGARKVTLGGFHVLTDGTVAFRHGSCKPPHSATPCVLLQQGGRCPKNESPLRSLRFHGRSY